MRTPRVLLLAALVTLACVWPPAAEAVRIPESEELQAWADQSRMPTPPGVIHVSDRPCPEFHEQVRPCSLVVQRVRIFLPVDFRAPGDRRFAFMHELGHVFALRVLDAGRDYTRFRRITGDTRDWDENTGTSDRPDSPAEQVAQAYARCSYDPRGIQPPADVSESAFTYSGWTPTIAEHRRACRLFRRAARRHERFERARRGAR